MIYAYSTKQHGLIPLKNKITTKLLALLYLSLFISPLKSLSPVFSFLSSLPLFITDLSQSLNCSLRGNQQLKCTQSTREGWTHGEGDTYGVLAACSINNNNAKKSIDCHAYLTAYAPTPKAATESTALLAMLCYICSMWYDTQYLFDDWYQNQWRR